jgi:hypothetical protein
MPAGSRTEFFVRWHAYLGVQIRRTGAGIIAGEPAVESGNKLILKDYPA